MSYRTSTVVAAFLATAGTFLLLPSDAEACSCMPPSLSSSWHESSDTFRGRVQNERVRGDQRQYVVEVQRTFGGCTQAGDVVVVETSVSSASCGTQLQVGESYLLTANLEPGAEAYAITLCGYNREWESLSGEDRDFLASRPVVCEDSGQRTTCADGSLPLACFVNSCDLEQSCDEAAVCEFNACGGCRAEYYDERWAPVCE